ncbi:hypothetical protein UFOVP685_57 [uncultured Caudovirales phage]|uniref:Uncharacterized protein n=1 Tax=uncultured Caudovirales phage TaxID=2100421 RepID=A0A6J5NL35_9CAUD|nr:hypothetical protein UFOVP590_27 [uncultured Caudovirales phage]CAB4157915.1 hypothetical protein UFOVP685_57 [uncultured Caudovirales phage]CAB5225626.1 hypothetical protein UFOVP750_56 [uncultured Caudovirales phage]
MNDFTKEELELIQWEINTAINNLNLACLSCVNHLKLNDKLKSMIDNYGTHETILVRGEERLLSEFCNE